MAWGAALCIMFGTAMAESENILYTGQKQQSNYDTAVVTRGVFEQVYSSDASPYYPYTHNLYVKVSGARFKKFLVETGDVVEAGTPLMEFTRDVDLVALERKRISFQRSEEAFEQRKAEYDAEIVLLTEQLHKTTDTWQREKISLQLERKILEQEKYILETEHSIAKAAKSLKEMEEDYAVTQLVAPVAGEVNITAYKREDDKIGTNEVMLTITEPQGMLFVIKNGNGYFRYGMDVIMEVGGNGNRIKVPGRVVASDLLIPQSRRLNYAFVEVDLGKLAEIKLTRPKVSAQVYYLDNVLTLPKKAVTLAAGKYYVTKLIDGMPAKRYINFVMNSQNMTLLFDGADEGETVIVE